MPRLHWETAARDDIRCNEKSPRSSASFLLKNLPEHKVNLISRSTTARPGANFISVKFGVRTPQNIGTKKLRGEGIWRLSTRNVSSSDRCGVLMNRPGDALHDLSKLLWRMA